MLGDNIVDILIERSWLGDCLGVTATAIQAIIDQKRSVGQSRSTREKGSEVLRETAAALI